MLFEILSRLFGYKQKNLQTFWCTTATRLDSYANNPEANAAWFAKMTDNQAKAQHGSLRRDMWLLSFVYNVLMRHDRLLRPTAKQVLDRLQNLDTIYPVNPSSQWIGKCCATELRPMSSILDFHWHVPQWPMSDFSLNDSHLAHVHLDLNLRILATSNNLSFLGAYDKDKEFKIQHLFPSRADLETLQGAVRSMLNIAKAKGIEVIGSVFHPSQIMNSVFPCPLEENVFWVDILNVVLDVDELPRVRTVQLSLQKCCLERQTEYHAAYLVMTFDPKEANEYDEKELSYREGRELWTDGTSVAATFVDKELASKYQLCRNCITDRRHKFLSRVCSSTDISGQEGLIVP